MDQLLKLRAQIYEQGQLFGVDAPLTADPLTAVAPGVRPNTIAVAGGAFGDEGKGRIVDELCARFAAQGKAPIVYRWNGGANAGHTVIVDGKRVSLHQIPSGALHENVRAVLGKGMVIHPGDLLAEIETIKPIVPQAISPARLFIDGMAVLALDTHRAFEAVLRDWETGGHGSTGRGISPAYADVLYRHPVRVRDLYVLDWAERLGRHYDLYAGLTRGLGQDIAGARVPSLALGQIKVGAKEEFIKRVSAQAAALGAYVRRAGEALPQRWIDSDEPLIFEGAQGIGLDPRFGVYPDITASDPTFGGILASTEGAVHPDQIAVRAGAIKATYTSSVGQRRLPTEALPELAQRIREDAHEYGATTRRPRDIAHIDLPCLGFFARLSGVNHLILTHLDIAYPDVPIKICTHYTDSNGQAVPYRPDQQYLNGVRPQYIELPSWDGAKLRGTRALADLPREALQYIAFITRALGVQPLIATTGPERAALISWLPG